MAFGDTKAHLRGSEHVRACTFFFDIRSLYCPLKFSSSQISIDKRVGITHIKRSSHGHGAADKLSSSLSPSLHSIFLLRRCPAPAASLLLLISQQKPRVTPSFAPLFLSSLPLFLPFLSALPLANWQIVFY